MSFGNIKSFSMTLKILHICTQDYGGAGLAVYRLHKGLLDHGIESRMLVAEKTSHDNTVIQAEPDRSLLYQPPENVLLRNYVRMMRRHGKYLTRFECIQRKMKCLADLHPDVYYSSPVSIYRLLTHPLVQESDIIHLHWIQNFVDYETFFNAIDKPIVWTHHDLNPIYGGFHYDAPYRQYYADYKSIEDDFSAIKKNAIEHVPNLTIVAVSKQMHSRIANHELYKNRTFYDIPNSVNTHRFIQHDRNAVRRLLNIPGESKVFFFSALSLNDKRKGLDVLMKAFDALNIDNALLLCLGEGYISTNSKIEIRHFSPVSDTEWLSFLYSAADYFIAPSLEESFLQTAVESLSCGTPVIMTPVGIGEELISEHNGILCSDFTPESIAEGIMNALSRIYDRDRIRNDVLVRFGIDRVVQEHLKMYKTIIE